VRIQNLEVYLAAKNGACDNFTDKLLLEGVEAFRMYLTTAWPFACFKLHPIVNRTAEKKRKTATKIVPKPF
jgi:hypothetical protein